MSDTNLGIHFAPHKTNCRCDDCHMERLQTQNMALKTKLAAAEADAAFFRCCALCGETPKPGSEPSAIDAARGDK